jgi:hypothetical protein
VPASVIDSRFSFRVVIALELEGAFSYGDLAPSPPRERIRGYRPLPRGVGVHLCGSRLVRHRVFRGDRSAVMPLPLQWCSRAQSRSNTAAVDWATFNLCRGYVDHSSPTCKEPIGSSF